MRAHRRDRGRAASRAAPDGAPGGVRLAGSGKPPVTQRPITMPKLHISNCDVRISDSEAVLSCTHAGTDYHVWLDARGTVQEPLYKNTGDKSGPRRLSITSRFGAALVAEMLAQMKSDSLDKRALATYRRKKKEEAYKRRMNTPLHLIVGTNDQGYLHFVSINKHLTQNIRDAALFTDSRRRQADIIACAQNSHRARHHRAIAWTVLTLSRGQLDTLKGTRPKLHYMTPSANYRL